MQIERVMVILGFLVMSSQLASGDVIAFATGELVMGNVERYENGFFHGDFGEIGRNQVPAEEIKRIAFAGGRQGSFTTTAGKKGTFPMAEYEKGCFVCMKSSVETASIQRDRILAATFFSEQAFEPLVSSSEYQTYRTPAPPASIRYTGHSYSHAAHSSYGGHDGGGSSVKITYYGGRVWVDGYYRSDGTWVEGHWREQPGMGTSTSATYRGGSTYVHGYYRKDGTYVHGHRRRK